MAMDDTTAHTTAPQSGNDKTRNTYRLRSVIHLWLRPSGFCFYSLPGDLGEYTLSTRVTVAVAVTGSQFTSSQTLDLTSGVDALETKDIGM